jgi:hypothetical protein
MKEQLITCPKCEGNACSEVSNEQLTVWNCFGCGFTSNSTMIEKNIKITEIMMPELYKNLKFIDANGYHWYPNSVVLDDKSMVFADSKALGGWEWAAVKGKDGKADMTTKQEFEQNNFMDALEYIGYFKYAQQE